ncbi:hypothetical protein J3A83DRAFT_1706951 [Scleroderma citrinum]
MLLVQPLACSPSSSSQCASPSACCLIHCRLHGPPPRVRQPAWPLHDVINAIVENVEEAAWVSFECWKGASNTGLSCIGSCSPRFQVHAHGNLSRLTVRIYIEDPSDAVMPNKNKFGCESMERAEPEPIVMINGQFSAHQVYLYKRDEHCHHQLFKLSLGCFDAVSKQFAWTRMVHQEMDV